ncbi:hypothetical protein M3E74_07040 [Morganella morganii]|uniref:hypothetical protein n=1 Tax=Morganella morganii TaxID=582 RepID=UPI0021A43691|nr:hypothetical protein [Morganella morganii]MCT1587209.1 hypothetical protein [Morganella morganii]
MKNPKLIVKPFAKNGQKNVIPENYETSMESNQATWDQGFGQITMLPVAAGGLPPKGQDFNGIFNQISENIVYLSQGGRFKFSAEYAEAIGGYPKGAILQSDDEKKEYLSLIDNNKVNFNTATDISESWKLVNTDDLLAQIASKQPKGDYATKTELNSGLAGKQPVGDYATKTEVGSKLDKTAVVQSTGTSTVDVMSQKTVTDELNKKFDKIGGMVSGQVDIASPGGRALTLKPVGESETSVYLEGYLNNILKWWLGMTGGNTVTLENTVTSRKMKITDKFNVNGQLDVESNGGRVNTLKATAGTSVYQELYLQAALAAWWGITNSNKLSIANVVTGNTLTIGDDGFRIDGKVIGKEESIIGIGQTYKDVTSTRKNGVTYTNTSTKPIIIYVESNRTASTESDPYSIGGEVNGIRVAYRWTTANETMSISFIVPPGASYMFKGGWGQTHPWEPVLKVVELS